MPQVPAEKDLQSETMYREVRTFHPATPGLTKQSSLLLASGSQTGLRIQGKTPGATRTQLV